MVRMGWLIGRVLFAVPPRDGTVDDHPSPAAVADNLQRPTRELGRTALERSLSGLAPGGVCLATTVSRRAGGLLHHRFTLTSAPKTGGGLFSVALIPRVAPGGCCPPPRPVEPGPSSTPRSCPLGDAVARPAHPRLQDRGTATIQTCRSAIKRSCDEDGGLLHVRMVLGRPSRARRGHGRVAPSPATT